MRMEGGRQARASGLGRGERGAAVGAERIGLLPICCKARLCFVRLRRGVSLTSPSPAGLFRVGG